MASDASWRNVYEDTRPRWSYDEDDGYHYGYHDGYSQGYAKAKDDYDQGYYRGFEEGKASVLQELIDAKKTIKKLERKKKALLNRRPGDETAPKTTKE